MNTVSKALRMPRSTVASIIVAVRKGMESLRAEPPMRLSEWAAKHFLMTAESSHQKGGWIAWACQVGIMDFMSDDRIEELAVAKSKRVGYTKILTAFIAYNIAHRRRKQALWQPTDADRDSYVKGEIDPVLEAIDAVQKARKSDSANTDTISLKQYRDSVLHLLGGKAKRAYRRITVAIAMLDEWSAFDWSIEKSGDPGGLAKGRTEGAPYPKFIGGSTPFILGLCHVTRAVGTTEGLVRFHIECPHCMAEHPLIWGGPDKAYGMKWLAGQPHTVRHVCPHCRESITQADYLPSGQPLAGAWVCERTHKRYGTDMVWRDMHGVPCRPPRTLGVHIWAAYSPQRDWWNIVDEYEKAQRALEAGDAGPMQTFVNETLGEAWEVVGERMDEHELQKRAEPYPLGTVRSGGLILTAGIDVQRTRWEIAVWAWGRGMESWVVEHAIIEGNPADEKDWELVTAYLQRRYVQEWHGSSMGLSAISIDSSDQTQAVYNWVRQQQYQLPRLRAVKGRGEENIPVLGPSSPQEINWRGQKWPAGIKLWNVGVDSAKDLLLGQLGLTRDGPGKVHFSDALTREWFEQLTAEQRILVKINGKECYRWVPRRKRNEVLDCRNYALHAAFGLGLHNYTERRWQELEASVQPAPDLFSQALTAASVTPETPTAVPPLAAPSAAAHPAAPVETQPTLRSRRHAAVNGFGRDW